MSARPTWLALAALALLALPTGFLARARLGLTIDLENRSLKSQDTAEAAAQARRVAGFGEDPTVVLLFRAVPLESGRIEPLDVAAVEALQRELAAQPGVLAVEPLPARDAAARALVLRIASDDEGRWRGPVEAAVALARARTPATLHLAVSGQPIGELAISAAVQADQRRIVPLVVAGLALLLLVVYRRVGPVVAILAPAGAGILWIGGLLALAGRSLDPIAVLLDPVLLTVGVAASVHLVERYLADRALGMERWNAAREALRDLWRPATLATFTTVVGFLSLGLHPIPAVVDFGLFAALGTSLTSLLVLVVTPLLLALLDRGVDQRALGRRLALWDAAGSRLTGWIARRATSLRWIAALIALAGAATWTGVHVDNDPLRILPPGHPLRIDTQLVAEELGGSDTFDVLLPAGSPLAEPTRAALLAADLLERPGVAGPVGGAQRSAGGDLLVTALLSPGGSRQREQLFGALERRGRAFGDGQLLLAGTSVQVARDSARLIRGQMRGLLATLVVLFGVFALAFRSLRLGLLAMLPNMLPCLAIYGGLAALGQPVSVATAMISSVLLGLIVDDTIHLLHRYRNARLEGLARRAAVERALDHAGRAVVVTSLVLAGGFSCSLLGALETSREFGALAALTILLALVADLLLLPALLLRPEAAADQP